MKIKLYSQYDHFSRYAVNTEEEADLVLYNDEQTWHAYDSRPRGESALLIEPRSIQPAVYHNLETRYERFETIYTHDSQLLAIAPNAKPILWWNQYEIHDEPKTKGISMICGQKELCALHIERKKIATKIQYAADILGDWQGGPRVSTHDAHAPYMFSIVIENYYDDNWFTEKILNCFGSKTVPIYFGARNIGNIFNTEGIIQVDRLWDIPGLVGMISFDPEGYYKNMLEAVEDNFKRVQTFQDFQDWFVKKYEDYYKPMKGYRLEEVLHDRK